MTSTPSSPILSLAHTLPRGVYQAWNNSMHITIDGRETAAILQDILTVLTHLTLQGERLMTIASSTQQKLDAIVQGVNNLGTELATATVGIRSDITDLKTAVANGQITDPTDINNALDGVLAAVQGVQVKADALAALDAENPATMQTPTGTGSEGGPVDSGA